MVHCSNGVIFSKTKENFSHEATGWVLLCETADKNKGEVAEEK